MFGYQWGSGQEPRPFYTFVAGQLIQTDLVVQSVIASTLYGPYTPSGPNRAFGQIALFAYLIDTTHPNLHPIALVAQTHDSQNANNYGFISCDYPTGVWFASGDTTNSTAYMTQDPYSANSKLLTAVHNPSALAEFYWMRISNANMTNIANAINSSPLGGVCPARGYSTNPYDYVLKYGGIITEVFIEGDVTSSTLNDPSIAQVSLGLNFSGVSMYRRY